MIYAATYRALSDALLGLAKWRVWLALSWQEFLSTYRRSALGVLWVVLSFAGFLGIKLVIFSSLLESEDQKYYDSFLILGFYVWMYLIQSVNAAPDTFLHNEGWIQSEPLPYSLYIYKSIMREIYNLVLTGIVLILALMYVNYPVPNGAWKALPGLAMIVASSFSLKLLLGTISARLRDLSHMVKAIMMPMMFLTPIFWMPSQMPDLMTYLWWNPLYHLIELFRYPILEGELPVESWIFVSCYFGIISALGFAVFARYRTRIVFWF